MVIGSTLGWPRRLRRMESGPGLSAITSLTTLPPLKLVNGPAKTPSSSKPYEPYAVLTSALRASPAQLRRAQAPLPPPRRRVRCCAEIADALSKLFLDLLRNFRHVFPLVFHGIRLKLQEHWRWFARPQAACNRRNRHDRRVRHAGEYGFRSQHPRPSGMQTRRLRAERYRV